MDLYPCFFNVPTKQKQVKIPVAQEEPIMVFGGHDPSQLNIYYHHPDHLGSSSYITNDAGVVCQHMEYLPFGETLIDEHLNSNNSPFKFNGKEFDEETGNYYYSARYYDPKLSIFISVDPLAEETMDSYGYCYQNPVNFVDPTGMEGVGDYYNKAGKWLGTDKIDDNIAYVVDEGSYKPSENGYIIKNSGIHQLDVDHDVLIGFAATIHAESGGSMEESYAIGNVTMNFICEGGSTQLKTLEDVVMYDNRFAQGATQENYSTFMGLKDKNSKFAIGAAINAVGHSQGLIGFSDYSGGADSWDGVDLIQKSYPGGNPHRGYSWSTSSKDLLSTYKKSNNGGVDVSKFNYKDKGYQIQATKIIGKTLFTNLQGGRGEKKQSTTRFRK